MKDGNGEVIGHFVGYDTAGKSGPTKDNQDRYDLIVMSETGFVFVVSYRWELTTGPGDFLSDNAVLRPATSLPGNGRVDIQFLTTDCTGQAYYPGVTGGFVTDPSRDGDLQEVRTGVSLWYSPKTEMAQVLQPLSFHPAGDESECAQLSTSGRPLVRAFPNDPEVTGVDRSDFPLPVYLDFEAGFGTMLFQDRFEQMASAR